MSKREQCHIGGDSGKVKVFVRVRPLNKDENINKAKSILRVSEDKGQISLISDTRRTADKVYQFDHVFGPLKTNHQVCAKISQPIVDSALSGFNGTLMAYGQTGTGKTHTLMASDGIAQSIIQKVFDQVQTDGGNDYKVSVAYLQIYQEKIHDLLNFNNKVELHIREKPRSGIFVENLTEYVIRSASEALSLLAFGKKRLIFAETKMNHTSSRSHSVFQLAIEKTPKKEKNVIEQIESKHMKATIHNKKKESVVKMVGWDEDVIVKGKIHLCDLAGSERIKKTHAVGERLCEAQHINSSLLELGNVIQALADDSSTHIPFRNSVLTRLLQESLGGNCKTSLIVCVSPGLRDAGETKSSLNFGSRAMKVENIAYVNVEVDYKKLSESLLRRLEEYESELHVLRQENILIKELTEKIDAEGTLDDICKPLNDDTIKSLKSAHVNEVEGLALQIMELTEDIKLKDEQIEKLSCRIDLLTKEKAVEENVAKFLLMNEMSSFEILSASEFERLRASRAQYNENLEIIVEAMMEHCQTMMINGAKMFLPESTGSSGQFESKDVNRNEIDTKKGTDVWKDMKTALMKSKEDFEIKLRRICWNGKTTHDFETPKDSFMWDLCKVFVQKDFFTSNLALENLELRQENELLKNEVQKFQNGVEIPEDFDENLKRTRKVQNDVDEKLSGFEVTLSKIEKILSDKPYVKINESKFIERSRNVADHQLNEQHVNRKVADPDEGNFVDMQWNGVSTIAKQHMMKSVTKKQEENLAEFISNNRKKNSTKNKDITCKQTDSKSISKGMSLDEFGASRNDEIDLISVAVADAKELSEIIGQFIDNDDAIKEVKLQIERHRSKHQKKCKKKDIKRKTDSFDPIRKESETASGAERQATKELLTRGHLDTNTACRPKINCETKLQTKVFFSEYSMSSFLCSRPCRPVCSGGVRVCSINNQFARLYHDYISDSTLSPKCISRARRMQQDYNSRLSFDARVKLYGVIGRHHFSDTRKRAESDSHRLRRWPFELGLSYMESNGLRKVPKDMIEHYKVTNEYPQGIERRNSSDERKELVKDYDLTLRLQCFGLFAGKCSSFSDSGPKTVLHESSFDAINSNEDCTQILNRKSYVEDHQNEIEETHCNASDDELKLKTGSLINSNDSENEDIDIHMSRNRKEKEEIEESAKSGDFSLLEVKIVSGSEGYCCYGDSFASPLCKQAFSNSNVSEEKIPESNQDDLTLPISQDEEGAFENVIIKTPWSFSQWLLGKRNKSKASNEKTVVCQ